MVNRITLSLRSHIIEPSAEINSDIGLDMPWTLPSSWRSRLRAQGHDSACGGSPLERRPRADSEAVGSQRLSGEEMEMDSGGNTLVDVSAQDYELDDLRSTVENGVGPSHK